MEEKLKHPDHPLHPLITKQICETMNVNKCILCNENLIEELNGH